MSLFLTFQSYDVGKMRAIKRSGSTGDSIDPLILVGLPDLLMLQDLGSQSLEEGFNRQCP